MFFSKIAKDLKNNKKFEKVSLYINIRLSQINYQIRTLIGFFYDLLYNCSIYKEASSMTVAKLL
jgi:hypothetical protein